MTRFSTRFSPRVYGSLLAPDTAGLSVFGSSSGPPNRVMVYQEYDCFGPESFYGGSGFECYDTTRTFVDSLLHPPMKIYCDNYPETCYFSGNGPNSPSDFANPIYVPPSASVYDSLDLTGVRPDCNHPASPAAAVWCQSPVPIGPRAGWVNAAITSMRSLGGYCVTLANTLDALATRGDIHISSSSTWPDGGDAPLAAARLVPIRG